MCKAQMLKVGSGIAPWLSLILLLQFQGKDLLAATRAAMRGNFSAVCKHISSSGDQSHWV